ncbi:hypothetical protein OUZ56_031458 [Daphnia magna]|uniref:Secreted protein n=1 Tax=Daphnia magna TaxID=35525 RepID=A0ABQ9ZUA3_9CRUS|nr:hypothetical protein OUZ56_031458 [Daphnia magna]
MMAIRLGFALTTSKICLAKSTTAAATTTTTTKIKKSILVEAVQRQQRDTRRSGRQTLASLTEGQDQNAARATPATSQQLKFSRKNTQKKGAASCPAAIFP